MHTSDPSDDWRSEFTSMKVAIVHEWLVSFRGSEKVLLELARMFPQAVIYASVLDRSVLPEELVKRDIRTTFIQRLPRATRWYQKYLPLMPLAYESLDLKEYDLVLSSSHCCAKGVIPSPSAFHLCYCYTPMRYAWSEYHSYRSSIKGRFSRRLMSVLMLWLRMWDVATVPRVDQFVACSHDVQRRIKRYYGRDSRVVFPPVDPPHLDVAKEEARRLLSVSIPGIGDKPFYLSLGRLVAYKRVDLAIQACNELRAYLVVAGTGPELQQLRKMAGPTIFFVEDVDDSLAHMLYSQCEAFLFPGEEDFGITVVEAQMHGKSVIAYGGGGALDTVLENRTGTFFAEQTVSSLVEAIKRRNEIVFHVDDVIQHATRFSQGSFRKELSVVLQEVYMRRAPASNNTP